MKPILFSRLRISPQLDRLTVARIAIIALGASVLAASPASAAIVVQGDVSPAVIPPGNMVMGNMVVGVTAIGSLEVNSGDVLKISDDLRLGEGLMAQGAADINGTNSTIEVTGNSIIGYTNVGTFTQSEGFHEVAQSLILSNSFQSDATYTQSGGTVDVQVGTIVGKSNTAQWIQIDGDHMTGGLIVAAESGTVASYRLDQGSLTIRNQGQSTIGQRGRATFTQEGGMHKVDTLAVASQEFSEGTYTLGGGNVMTDNSFVGLMGSGGVDQFGGTHRTEMDLTLGSGNKGVGEYNLMGGLLDIDEVTFVGDQGRGDFTLSGGTHNSGAVIVANMPGSIGVYDYLSGTLNAGIIIVGEAGNGTYQQSAGTATVGAFLRIGVDGLGEAIVTDGAKLNVMGDIDIARKTADGTLTITRGAQVTANQDVKIGGSEEGVPPAGYVEVRGKDSLLKATNVNVGGIVVVYPPVFPPDPFLVPQGAGELVIGNRGTVDATVTVFETGTLKGKEGLKNLGNLIDNGGMITAAPGLFQINGSFAQNDTGILNLKFKGDGMGGVNLAHFEVATTSQFAFGTEINFTFNGFLPEAGDEFEFWTTSSLLMTPRDDNRAAGVFTGEVHGVAPGFAFEIKSTPTSLIFVALTDAERAVPEPAALTLWMLGGLLVRILHTRSIE